MHLFEISSMLHTEVMPVLRTDITCLDEARLLNYLRNILHDPDIPETPEQWQQRLLGLSFLTQTGENICCTIAGLVLLVNIHVSIYVNRVSESLPSPVNTKNISRCWMICWMAQWWDVLILKRLGER